MPCLCGIGIFAHWEDTALRFMRYQWLLWHWPFYHIACLNYGVEFTRVGRIKLKKSRLHGNAECFSKEHGSWFRTILASHVVAALIILAAIIPNLGLAIDRSKGLATVLASDEVKILDEIKQKSQPGDYVLTWWDGDLQRSFTQSEMFLPRQTINQ